MDTIKDICLLPILFLANVLTRHLGLFFARLPVGPFRRFGLMLLGWYFHGLNWRVVMIVNNLRTKIFKTEIARKYRQRQYKAGAHQLLHEAGLLPRKKYPYKGLLPLTEKDNQ